MGWKSLSAALTVLPSSLFYRESIKVKTPFNFHPPSPNNNDALAPKIEIGFSFEILNSLDLKQLKLN